MFPIFYSLLFSLRVWFRSKVKLQLEIISLRHQLAITQRQNPKPRLTAADRCLWVWLSRNFANWRSVLLIVKPAFYNSRENHQLLTQSYIFQGDLFVAAQRQNNQPKS
jgi:hypothetical protein